MSSITAGHMPSGSSSYSFNGTNLLERWRQRQHRVGGIVNGRCEVRRLSDLGGRDATRHLEGGSLGDLWTADCFAVLGGGGFAALDGSLRDLHDMDMIDERREVCGVRPRTLREWTFDPGLPLRGKPGHPRGCMFGPGLPLRGKPGH